ncbi:methyltransferase type 11 [Lanmaoa asiatica]|nr:methyltransferase type 11 [Lanmaoa asiatica]
MQGTAIYSHGHHESVLRSHSSRTAQNSAAYLIKYLQPTMHILDIGCGPGTITVSFARLVPQGHVTGIDYVPADSDVLGKARQHATEQGVTNITFAHGDICNLVDIPDNTYDVVHCHQVLQHVRDPVKALKEMRRVAKPGGLVAAREADSKAFAWYPETKAMEEWIKVYQDVAHANGTEPDAGRKLVSWALAAGFERDAIEATAGAWCYSTPEERAWFSCMFADRTVHSTFATHAVERGFADREKLQRMADNSAGMGDEGGWMVRAVAR